MIYTRFGTKVEVIDGSIKDGIVKVKDENGDIRNLFTFDLKADRGLSEIQQEITRAKQNKERLFEIRAFDFEADEITSVWYTGDYSMLDLQRVLSEENMELDEEQTLQIYLDINWVEDKILLFKNEESLMDTPLKVLLDNYKIYDMVHKIEMEFLRG